MIARTEPGLRTFFPFFSGRQTFIVDLGGSPVFSGERIDQMNPHLKQIVLLAAAAFAASIAPVKADSLPAAPTADSMPTPPRKIVQINYCGNRTTSPRMLRMYLGIDTGMVFDSVMVAVGKKRLMDTYLFSKVQVLHLQKPDGIYVFVLVTEFFYLMPTGGGDIIQGRYGNPKDVWYRLRLGISEQNFRGLFETFSAAVSVWDDKALSLSWSKPFAPSPYFLSVGAGVEEYPDLSFPRRRLVASGRITGGMRLLANSKTYLSISPSYNRIELVDSTNLRDNEIIPGSTISYSELFTQWGWITDKRNRSFDPSAGWYIQTSLGTNVLHPGTDNPFLQWNGNLQLFHEGPFAVDKFACRLTTTLRSNDAGPYRSLYIGGTGSIRGWPSDYLGRSAIMNDCAVFSGEYRFPIWPTPTFDLPMLCDYAPSLRGFYLRADGAVIFDAGQIWRDLPHPFETHENGEGFGIGLHVLAPTLLRSACMDVVWPFQTAQQPPHVHYSLTPGWHLYLDMCY